MLVNELVLTGVLALSLYIWLLQGNTGGGLVPSQVLRDGSVIVIHASSLKLAKENMQGDQCQGNLCHKHVYLMLDII